MTHILPCVREDDVVELSIQVSTPSGLVNRMFYGVEGSV